MLFALFLLLSAAVLLAFGTLLPALADLVLLAAILGLAGLYLLLRHLRQRPKQWIMVDGSNVMHWHNNEPRLATLQAVLAFLRAHGFDPCLVFDASAGHRLAGRYLHDHALGRLLGLPAVQVMVVPKGTPADPALLAAARDLGARIVTNDRFRDWAETYPEVGAPGHLVQGSYLDGKVWLDL